MEVKFNFDTIIFYVQDVQLLKSFYTGVFNFKVLEEYESSWTLLQVGNCKIGLHKIGKEYWDESKGSFKFDNNTKMVFEINEDINEMRALFLQQNVEMRQVKTFDNYDYWLCDGLDPEGNVFQLKQKKSV